MKSLAYLRSLVTKLFRHSQITDEMEAELRSHIQHRADDLESSGLARAEAERQARIEFGAQERFKEEINQEIGGNFIETAIQDVRYSLRLLRKTPGFTVAAVLTLAVAIGANAVVFSVMNALLLRPLNLPEEQSFYGLYRASDEDAAQSYPNYLDLRERNRSFEDLAAFNVTTAGLAAGKEPSRSWGYEVTGNYFDALHVQPYLGRFFHSSDEHGANSAPYIVLTYSYWHSHFQDDRGVAGRTIQVDKRPYTILGVAPPGFRGTFSFFNPDFFVPMWSHGDVKRLNDRGDRSLFTVMGHLKPGVTPAQAIADLNSIGADLEKNYPKENSQMTFSLARPSLYGDAIRRPVRAFMAGLMLLAGLILLAACANLGSLFAARAADRAREVALRLALGSSRSRILRGLFTEALLISLAGGVVGVWGSILLLSGLSVWQPAPRFPVQLSVMPDVNVYAVALLLTLASGFLFGVVPVRQILRTNPYEVVKSGSAGRIGRRITVRDLLLATQIALCALLMTSSMVAVRGLMRSLHSNFGFEPQNALLVDTDLPGYSDDQLSTMQKRMIEAVQTLPGVESVGMADVLLLDDTPNTDVFKDNTSDLRPANAATHSFMYHISPEYLHAERATLMAGRAFTWHDDKNSPRVAIVNREFARRIFGSAANAIGGNYKMPDGTRIQVVGMVEDGKYASLTEDPQAAMFLPFLQWPVSATELVVRSERDPQQLAPAIRDSLRKLDSGLLVRIEPRTRALDGVLLAPRMATIALGVMGALGAMLSITGIFGMAAYSVSKRRRELGIRIALGAQRKEVLQAALERPVKLLAAGSAAGLLLGILASRVLALVVFLATPRDPLVLAGVVLAMALLGLLATWIPAQRALSINPLILLREE